MSDPQRDREAAFAALDKARAELDSALQEESYASLQHTEARNRLERARKSYDERRAEFLKLLPEAEKVRR